VRNGGRTGRTAPQKPGDQRRQLQPLPYPLPALSWSVRWHEPDRISAPILRPGDCSLPRKSLAHYWLEPRRGSYRPRCQLRLLRDFL